MPAILAQWRQSPGVTRLICKQAKGDELTADERKQLNTCERATSTCVLRNGCI